jgi:SAM-dependent methyltransferase
VTCEYDALNHVPRKRDLRNVAREVSRALKPGGCFFFDVNNRAGFRRYWIGVFRFERPGAIAVMRNQHYPGDRASCDPAIRRECRTVYLARKASG